MIERPYSLESFNVSLEDVRTGLSSRGWCIISRDPSAIRGEEAIASANSHLYLYGKGGSQKMWEKDRFARLT